MEAKDLRDQIPYYLTAAAAEGLLQELEKYKPHTNIYASAQNEDLLQGDAWSKLTIFDFESSTVRKIKGIVVSNSCDISKDNAREIPPRLSFAPIVKLSKIQSLYEQSGKDAQAVQSKINAIREQRNTSMFYLPAGISLDEDYVALLSEISSFPLSMFLEEEGRSRFVTLNMVGFYLFLFKLSIHFCRFHENVER